MMKKKSRYLLTAVLVTLVMLLFTAAVSIIDVKPIGPAGTSVGFAGVNGAVAASIGSDENGFTYFEKLYDVTEKAGIVSFLWVGIFGVIGLVQLIRRKSLLKVDPEILALGVLYVMTVIIYALFIKVYVNGRPVLMPGETVPESSFPSSHTMQSLVIWLSAACIIGRYVKNKGLVTVFRILLPVIGCVLVLARALSGAHWASDIVGGVIYAAALLAWFAYFLVLFRKQRAANAKKHAPRR